MNGTTNAWLRRLGFHIWHVPGVSRAWRLDFAGGGYLLVTDVGGYDLPNLAGPCAAIAVSSSDETMDFQPWFEDMQALCDWLRFVLRQHVKDASQSDAVLKGIDAFQRWAERQKQLQHVLAAHRGLGCL